MMSDESGRAENEAVVAVCPHSSSYDCPRDCRQCIHGDSVEFVPMKDYYQMEDDEVD